MYRSLPLLLSAFLLTAASTLLQAESLPPPTKEPPLHTTRNSFFTIPFEIKVDEQTELPAEVELIYSTDLGMQWFPYERVTPDKKQFLFRARSDGEYWFIFNTYGKDGHLKQTKRRGPMLRVLVDTIPPKLTVEAEQRPTGELFIQWSTEDANLSRIYPRLQIMYSIPDQKYTYLSNWKPIAIDPASIRSEGSRHSGELVIWPDRDATALEIMAEMYDSGGNRETATQTITLTPNENSKDSNILTESVQTAYRDHLKRPQKRDGLASSKVRTAFAANHGGSNSSEKKPSTLTLTPPRPLILSATQDSQYLDNSPKTLNSKDSVNSNGSDGLDSSSRALKSLPILDENKNLKLLSSNTQNPLNLTNSPNSTTEKTNTLDSFEDLQFPLLPKIATDAGSQNAAQIANEETKTGVNAPIVPGPILFSELNDPDTLANNESRQAWERENGIDDAFTPLDMSNLFADGLDSAPTFATINPRYGSTQSQPVPSQTVENSNDSQQSADSKQTDAAAQSQPPVPENASIANTNTANASTKNTSTENANIENSGAENPTSFPPQSAPVAAQGSNPVANDQNPRTETANNLATPEEDRAAAWQRIINSQNVPPQLRQQEEPAQELANPVLTTVQISKISHLRGANSSQLLLKWETNGPENNWIRSKNVKVHIYSGFSQRGPWLPIAINLQNTGSHTWNVNQSFRNPFFILVQVEGEARELASDLTRTPIQLPASAF